MQQEAEDVGAEEGADVGRRLGDWRYVGWFGRQEIELDEGAQDEGEELTAA